MYLVLGVCTQLLPDVVTQAVSVALQSGYKHIDCAAVYGNEPEVKVGLQAAFNNGVKREGKEVKYVLFIGRLNSVIFLMSLECPTIIISTP